MIEQVEIGALHFEDYKELLVAMRPPTRDGRAVTGVLMRYKA